MLNIRTVGRRRWNRVRYFLVGISDKESSRDEDGD